MAQNQRAQCYQNKFLVALKIALRGSDLALTLVCWYRAFTVLRVIICLNQGTAFSVVIKDSRCLFGWETLSLWEHEEDEEEIEEQNSNIDTVTEGGSIFLQREGKETKRRSKWGVSYTYYFQPIAPSAIGLTNWLKELPNVAKLVNRAMPLDRMANGMISTVYATGRGVNAMS